MVRSNIDPVDHYNKGTDNPFKDTFRLRRFLTLTKVKKSKGLKLALLYPFNLGLEY
jgi:hypothetical protein